MIPHRVRQFWTASGVLKEDETFWTLDVIHDPKDRLWVAICSVSDQQHADTLTSRFAYTNSAAECDDLLQRGFPAIEGDFEFANGVLVVRSPVFLPGLKAGSEMEYDGEALRIEGLAFRDEAAMAQSPGRYVALRSFFRRYQQQVATPDPAKPDTKLRQRTIVWPFRRSYVVKDRHPNATIKLPALRWPTRTPFGQTMPAERIWTGRVRIPRTWPSSSRPGARRVPWFEGAEVELVDRPRFGRFEFEFKDVEVLGFRLAVPSVAVDEWQAPEVQAAERTAAWNKLRDLVKPLNFHLDIDGDEDRARPDFYYRPASAVLNIELLRYGKMARPNQKRGNAEDFQAQHELLVRTVIGRVDQDSAQVHEPATYVPAIFVDNRWSKSLGRQFLGMDKRLAHFCTKDGRLKPNGKPGQLATASLQTAQLVATADALAAGNAAPRFSDVSDTPIELSDITDVQLAEQVAEGVGIETGKTIFALRCDRNAIEGWDRFVEVPGEALVATSGLEPPRRWRQQDFDEKEVRRSFAREAVVRASHSFRAIQAAPVGEAAEEIWAGEKTWITARYDVMGKAQAASPNGVVEITLCNLTNAPPGWKAVCDLLGIREGDERTYVLPAGSWYRLKNDVNITLESGLEPPP